jgi:integrase
MALRFQRLTRPAIRALDKGQRINEHGITAERMGNGDVRFSVNIMADGVRVHRVIGRESEGVTREQAERAIEALRTKAREGRLDLPTGRKVHRLFREVATDYLARLTDTLGPNDKGFRDLPNKKRHIEQHLIPYFGKTRADKLKDFAIKHYARHRAEQGVKQATINRELSTLSHMLRRATTWKWIKAEDRPEIVKGSEASKPIQILTPKQQAALMQAAAGDQDPVTWLFVAFGLNAAMRHGEILRVRWSDVDFAQRRIHVPEAKAGERWQPITATLATMLERERDHRDDKKGYIFATTRKDAKRPHRSSMAKQFARAVVGAGLNVKKVTPHVMRHTAITALVAAKVDLPTVQKISGHKTLQMVLKYTHMTDSHVDASIDAIDTGNLDAVTPELHTAPRKAANDAA